MTVRVDVAPQMLAWARRRSGRSREELVERFPQLLRWEEEGPERSQPTLRQLEGYARATHTPLGYFFLAEPLEEELPIRDFRTVGDQRLRAPSADLLDVVHACQRRQDWYREFAEERGAEPVALVGSATRGDDPVAVASRLRDVLGFSLARRADFRTWEAALSGLVDLAERAGVLVMISGIVGSDTHRRLDVEEFRGFTLADDLAPLVFVNGADAKVAQLFTLAHELAHVVLGGSGISDTDMAETDEHDDVERWCNAAAAEFLVPRASLEEELDGREPLQDQVVRLARFYRVSTVVVLRRLFDTQHLSAQEYRAAYREERRRVDALTAERASGGDFYNTTPVRVSKTFARALIGNTVEGGTSYRDAYRLLGFKSHAAFEGMRDRLGVA